MIDCLAHLDDPRVDEVDALLERAGAAGLTAIINGSVDPSVETSGESWENVSYPRIYRAFGVHPVAVGRLALLEQLSQLEQALVEEEAVAIGEIGLDGREGFPALGLQQTFLEAQLELARSLELPVILHCVQATPLLITLLKRCGLPRSGGMVHGFTGSKETALEFLRLGLHISFGGMVTRPGAKRCRAAAAVVPADRLLLESDCPDHPPLGGSGQGSEPAEISITLQELARLRGESAEGLAGITEVNARSLFRILP